MIEPGLDDRHRTLLGRISRKHGNTLVGTLRKIYGQHFLPQFVATDDLADVLLKMDEPSLTKLHHDHPHDGIG